MKRFPMNLVTGIAALWLIGAPVIAQAQSTMTSASDPKSAETMNIGTLTAQATAGDAAAQLRLADDYFTGNGVAQDYDAAVIWYPKAAGQEIGRAACREKV